jgi:hypothetical protein
MTTEQPEEPSKRLAGQPVETWVDQAIQQAQRRGDFDNLPGAGKPLRSLDRPDDPDWWLKGLLQREQIDVSEALPGPMALRRERETYPESLLGVSDEAAVREVLEDFNRRVVEDRKRPHFGDAPPLVVGRVDVEETVQRWRALRAEAAPPTAPSADVAPVKAQGDGTAQAPAGRRWRWRWRGRPSG